MWSNLLEKLRPYLLSFFNIKEEEAPKFYLLFWHSFFLGIFIAMYFVPANAVFVKDYGSETLPLAYIVSGVVGWAVSTGYSQLQKNANSKRLFVGALLFTSLATLTIRFLGQGILPGKTVSFLAFVGAWPLTTLVGIVSGGLVLDQLNLRQAKRLFGSIGMGGVLAAVMSYFLIPVLVNHLGQPLDFFIIAASGTLVSTGLLMVIYRRYDPSKKDQESVYIKSKAKLKEEQDAPKHSLGFADLFQDKYLRWVMVVAMMSSVLNYFTDFGYLAAVRSRGMSADQVAVFLALVGGTFKFGELLISYFSSRLLSRYGVRLGLSMLPFTSLAFIGLATAVVLVFGVESVFFLVFMATNKIFDRVLRHGLDTPSINILYQPLPDHQKLEAQSLVGVVTQMSTGLAGLLLLLLSWLLTGEHGFQLRFYNFFFLPILLLWAFFSRRLYESYKVKLREILSQKKQEPSRHELELMYGSELLFSQLDNDNIDEVKMSATILSETNPLVLRPVAERLLAIPSATVQKAILRNVDSTYPPELLGPIRSLLESPQQTIRSLAEKAAVSIAADAEPPLKARELEALCLSGEPDKQIRAIKQMFRAKLLGDDLWIAQLLESPDNRVRHSAIALASQRDSAQLKARLVDMLNSPKNHHVVANALVFLGDRVLPQLAMFFDPEQARLEVLLKVVEVCARVGSEAAQDLLLKNIDYQDREVQAAIIRALYFSEFQARENQSQRVKDKIVDTIRTIVWLFASINDVVSERNTLKLIQSLDLEREASFERLFMLLSFLYQPATIDLIKKNIIGENTIFALEIIENFIRQDLKEMLVPLFDDISLSQKVKKLQHFFPQEKLRFTDRLRDIIVKDFDSIDLWSKTKAIELLGKIHRRKKEGVEPGSKAVAEEQVESNIRVWVREEVDKLLLQIRRSEMPDEIFACLYHADELIYSTAAKIIYDENPARCFDYLKKLSPEKQEMMEMLSSGNTDKKLLVEKVKMLKRLTLFFSVPENVLVKMAKIMNVWQLKKGQVIDLNSETYRDDIFVVVRGGLKVQHQDDDSEILFNKNDILVRGLNFAPETDSIIADKQTIVLHGNRYNYFNLLLEETDIISHIFEQLLWKRP